MGTAAPCKKVPQVRRDVFTAGSGIGTGSSRASKSQQTLVCPVNPALQKQAAKDISLWAFATGTSFSAVDNSMFMSGMRSVAKAGLAFKPPSRKQLATTLLNTVYDETKSQVQAEIEKHRKYGFSLCSDGSSDVNSHPIINIVLMISRGQYFLGSVDASGVTKNGDYISAVLNSCIEQVGPAYIVCIIFQACGSLELLTYPDTRFAYALLMLERFRKVKRTLIQTVKSSDWETYRTKQYVSTLCVSKEHVCPRH